MSERQIAQIKFRIEVDMEHYGESPPNHIIWMWVGYLAALCEHDLISSEEFQILRNILPELEDNPVVHLHLGGEYFD